MWSEFDAKRKLQRERSQEVKARMAHLTNGVYAPSHVERDYVER